MFIVGDFRPVVETTVQSTSSSTSDSTTVPYRGIWLKTFFKTNGFCFFFFNFYTNKTALCIIIFFYSWNIDITVHFFDGQKSISFKEIGIALITSCVPVFILDMHKSIQYTSVSVYWILKIIYETAKRCSNIGLGNISK